MGSHVYKGLAQSVTSLTTDASLTADTVVTSLIPARSYTFLEIDNEIISIVILLIIKAYFYPFPDRVPKI